MRIRVGQLRRVIKEEVDLVTEISVGDPGTSMPGRRKSYDNPSDVDYEDYDKMDAPEWRDVSEPDGKTWDLPAEPTMMPRGYERTPDVAEYREQPANEEIYDQVINQVLKTVEKQINPTSQSYDDFDLVSGSRNEWRYRIPKHYGGERSAKMVKHKIDNVIKQHGFEGVSIEVQGGDIIVKATQ